MREGEKLGEGRSIFRAQETPLADLLLASQRVPKDAEKDWHKKQEGWVLMRFNFRHSN